MRIGIPWAKFQKIFPLKTPFFNPTENISKDDPTYSVLLQTLEQVVVQGIEVIIDNCLQIGKLIQVHIIKTPKHSSECLHICFHIGWIIINNPFSDFTFTSDVTKHDIFFSEAYDKYTKKQVKNQKLSQC